MQSKTFRRYGCLWEKEQTTDLAIELWCYRNNWKESDGGLGKQKHFLKAFHMMWPKFAWHLWMEMLVEAWCKERVFTVIGHTRATKTYGCARLAYLDYLAAPLETWTSLTTVTFDGLKSRMWSDLLSGIGQAKYHCPFRIMSNSGEMKIYPKKESGLSDAENKEREKYQIEGFATSKTKDSAGRIQGKHAPRRRLVLDEAQELPAAIFEAEVNAMSADDFISVRLANPVDKLSVFGTECCEPAEGWEAITDTDLFWRTKGGHLVLHFDGLQCHNMRVKELHDAKAITDKQYKDRILPFMISPEYVEEVRASKGENSLEWWKYVRGFFPPDGTVGKVFPEVIIERMKKHVEFDFEPTPIAMLDPAFEYDDCVIQFGDFGKLRDGRYAINFTETERIRTKLGKEYDPKDYQIAYAVRELCKARGIKPENYIQDCTGNGRGVLAILQKEWGRECHGCAFGGSPTERPINTNDATKCKELFVYFVDELWFRMSEWATAGLVGGITRLDKLTLQDLGQRRYTLQGNKRRVETKNEVKKELGRSPDYGDAFVLASELLARKGIYADGIGKRSTGANTEERRKRVARVNSIYQTMHRRSA